MFEEINKFFDNLPRILLEELRKNSLILKKLSYNEIIAGICYISALVCNKQITKGSDLELHQFPRKKAIRIVKRFLEYIDKEIIKLYLKKSILLSETRYTPIDTLGFYDIENSIRVVNLSKDISELIWNNLPPKVKKITKMKRYFKYKLDNPPLNTVIPFINYNTNLIKYLKGHGISPIVKIPKKLDKDLAYILGALRDGGIHYDLKNNAYKIHFE
jgi:hypothetical protein